MLIIVAALTHTGKAETNENQNRPQEIQMESKMPEKTSQNDIPFGKIIGVTAAGILAAIGMIKSSGDYKYTRYWAKEDNVVPPQPKKTEQLEKATQPEKVKQPQKADQSRDLLAQKLHAFRQMEDIKRERYKLTRQMAKAKKENDTEAMEYIKSLRTALSCLHRQAFQEAMGPIAPQIKEERRMLTKKMTLAKRKKDINLQAEITKRRAFLKQLEMQAKAEVRQFNYKQERPKFIKKHKNVLSEKQVLENRQHALAA